MHAPELTLAGPVMRDHYQVASLTLAFARSSALGRESCWALALGIATLASCMVGDATASIQRASLEASGVRVKLFGTWNPNTRETIALTLSRLRELGFRTPPSHEDSLLELQS